MKFTFNEQKQRLRDHHTEHCQTVFSRVVAVQTPLVVREMILTGTYILFYSLYIYFTIHEINVHTKLSIPWFHEYALF